MLTAYRFNVDSLSVGFGIELGFLHGFFGPFGCEDEHEVGLGFVAWFWRLECMDAGIDKPRAFGYDGFVGCGVIPSAHHGALEFSHIHFEISSDREVNEAEVAIGRTGG